MVPLLNPGKLGPHDHHTPVLVETAAPGKLGAARVGANCPGKAGKVFTHLLSSTEGIIALAIHDVPEGTPGVEYLATVNNEWSRYDDEWYFEFDVKSVSENPILLNWLVENLNWNSAKLVLQEVGQYREANRGVDMTCTLQCALFDLQTSLGLLYSLNS